ncbi:hypothetical protein Y1Q_0011316 [Alligator mississippiensis]|uniref:Uncharacterized protein n=1 Tax=Alligator mississippiensis TaxID=8496 RepID=A0A151N853_ALLMI|nr:hypothetical protein Y1Q_0011316 [Alligator mississippiensis]
MWSIPLVSSVSLVSCHQPCSFEILRVGLALDNKTTVVWLKINPRPCFRVTVESTFADMTTSLASKVKETINMSSYTSYEIQTAAGDTLSEETPAFCFCQIHSC